jgi:cystathionine beta-synthase
MDYKENILQLIGRTPLVKLNKVTRGIEATVLAKLESMNPGGSVKDRIGIAMIERAEREGRLKPGGSSWSRPVGIRASDWRSRAL